MSYGVMALVRDKNGIPRVDDPVTLPPQMWALMTAYEVSEVWRKYYEKQRLEQESKPQQES